MKLLADTHIALWLIADPSRLSSRALSLMQDPDNTWFLSLVSVWEVALKHAKRPEQIPLSAQEFHDDCLKSGLRDLPITHQDVYGAGELPAVEGHADPFDRMLLAQAQVNGLLLVTHDESFGRYEGVPVLIV